jgi:hypothetical protein
VCTHVPCSTEPCLLAKVGSGATTCPVAPYPSSLIGRALAPPRVLCTVALDPTSQQGRAPVRHVFYSSVSCVPAGEGSGAPRVLRL